MACNANYLIDAVHVDMFSEMGGKFVVLFFLPVIKGAQSFLGGHQIVTLQEPTYNTMPQLIVIK